MSLYLSPHFTYTPQSSWSLATSIPAVFQQVAHQQVAVHRCLVTQISSGGWRRRRISSQRRSRNATSVRRNDLPICPETWLLGLFSLIQTRLLLTNGMLLVNSAASNNYHISRVCVQLSIYVRPVANVRIFKNEIDMQFGLSQAFDKHFC